jgi:hypothetical protein
MTAQIEKKNILPELGDELAKLKQEVLKQAPQLAKQEKKPSTKKAQEFAMENDLSQKESADKALEVRLNESEAKLENLATNESSENRNEKTPTSRTKIVGTKGQNFDKMGLHLPSDAPVVANNNRIKDANTTLQTMLAAT